MIEFVWEAISIAIALPTMIALSGLAAVFVIDKLERTLNKHASKLDINV